MRRPAFFALILGAVLSAGCAAAPPDREIVYQFSTLTALMEGVFEGEVQCGEVAAHGDLGLGTFDALDGEMAVVDGRVYQIREDGRARVVEPGMKSPFAVVTFFEPDIQADLPGGTDYKALEALLDKDLPAKNYPVAIRVEGVFHHVKTRVPPPQDRPYPPMAKALEKQRVFEFKDTAGVMVGFRLPPSLGSVSVQGYHLHFLTADRKAGGHVLEFEAASGKAGMDVCSGFRLELPSNDSFRRASLRPPGTDDLNRIRRPRK